jgi:hypothetical protein
MSYCRFENTDRDLADCEEELVDILQAVENDMEHDRPLSSSELEAAVNLIMRCQAIVYGVRDALNIEEGEMYTEDAINDMLVRVNGNV